MLSSNAMLSFMHIGDFFEFYNSLDIYGGWRINVGLMNDRGKQINNKIYTEKIRKIFMNSNLFRRNISIAEITSLLDTYTLMYRVLESLQKKLSIEQYSELKLHSEYKIDFSKNRRVDFVLEYKNKILLCEFRISCTFPNVSSMWHKKELELIVYKELMRNYIPDQYKIILFAFIGMPEYDGGKSIEKNVNYNKSNVDFFVSYIIKYLIY